MFKVYALYSSKFNKIYIGYSSNLEQRLKSHSELATKGYALKYRPWKLVYSETQNTKLEALIREKQLKATIHPLKYPFGPPRHEVSKFHKKTICVKLLLCGSLFR